MYLSCILKREIVGITLNEFLEQHSPSNIILAGDLNIVLKSKEKRGGINSRDTMLPMVEDLIQQWDLLDFIRSKGSTHGPTTEWERNIYQPVWIDFLSKTL
jgi:hypothetical protein